MVCDTWDTVSGGWTIIDTCTLLNGECGTSSTDTRHIGISIPSSSMLCGNRHGSNCVLTLTVTLTSRSAAVLVNDTAVHTHTPQFWWNRVRGKALNRMCSMTELNIRKVWNSTPPTTLSSSNLLQNIILHFYSIHWKALHKIKNNK